MNLSKEDWEVFTIVIQFGAILSVVVAYWGKFWGALTGLPTSKQARHFALSIILAFLPSAILGVALIKIINGYLLDPSRALPVIATSWIVGGLIILVFERIAPKPKYLDGDNLPLLEVHPDRVLPVPRHAAGVSRSGATILGGELLGVRAQSGRRLHVLPPRCRRCSARRSTNSTRTGAA